MSRPLRPFRASYLRLALLLSCAALAHADNPKPKPLPAPAQIAAAHQRFEPFSERVPLSTEPLEMIPIKGGKFLMAPLEKGAQPREVEVTPFYIARTELTFDHFDVFVLGLDRTPQEKKLDEDQPRLLRSRPSPPYANPDFNFGHQGFATLAASPESARRFCKWLSERTGRTYRLPTEAEWEFAARAGGPVTLDRAELDAVAWHRDNADDKTHPVARKKTNAWGLYDTLGNAAELCEGPDGQAVLRGGSWKTRPRDLSYAHREPQSDRWNRDDPNDPKSRWWLANGDYITFRLVCDAPEPRR